MVYFRGQPRDFDDWAARGLPGWSHADVLPYRDAITINVFISSKLVQAHALTWDALKPFEHGAVRQPDAIGPLPAGALEVRDEQHFAAGEPGLAQDAARQLERGLAIGLVTGKRGVVRWAGGLLRRGRGGAGQQHQRQE